MDNTIDRILYTAIVTYVITMFAIIITKPSIMYDHVQKKFKSFGTNDGETIMAVPIVGISMCILVYFLVILYHFVMIKLK
jgi:ribose/xylose/arabinose/galactoside ABC-type transport system permease subunit